MRGKQNILLESGTGELEILKFIVDDTSYAINVLKVREILRIKKEDIKKMPDKSDVILGMTNIRGDVIMIVNLSSYLKAELIENDGIIMAILAEFNNTKILFAVDNVVGISRIGWDDIQAPDDMMGDLVNGVIKAEDKDLINFLNFEKILKDLKPELGNKVDVKPEDSADLKARRLDKTLALADDSPTTRNMIKDTLVAAGYQDFMIFSDGQKLFDHLQEIKAEYPDDDILDHVQGIITDIEMPMMDGHTLIRKIHEDRYLRKLPTVIFSSLITEDLLHKGKDVGADAQITKPEIDKLVGVVDQLVKAVPPLADY
ncbi:chemotaxis protein [Halanaerobium salsuginis]|jgi:two-component system chemotaxis response regulator CheV|uniref:Stage 0 sporulation protein A homolog n=1 Tax=Halanaerobium salsuginis TaxID=29563 RepID=A0A1I4FW39_9FIRM|nr:chemotaxis protein [Halanaerobium salsuginis]SFL22035.1 two-component system, chemotaxis family, response regulator CheV [Halanaerobium salsuginis]